MQNEFQDYYKMIGLKIAYYRKLKGLTQEQLAEQMSVDKKRIGCRNAAAADSFCKNCAATAGLFKLQKPVRRDIEGFADPEQCV